ncbi:hypothetical protein [Roseibaca sp. Y0-43]|uniref:hypothetical protein n=1 Tax=Roseibaca sp. Y0-43 TaxID=2816854 RepID=UPI001D0C9024|nr:hypothetical protein [Roseibaca sp. Y0-43]MCC1481847.1 hypothetical protein [Roseibaca sp. Y0-43]
MTDFDTIRRIILANDRDRATLLRDLGAIHRTEHILSTLDRHALARDPSRPSVDHALIAGLVRAGGVVSRGNDGCP